MKRDTHVGQMLTSDRLFSVGTGLVLLQLLLLVVVTGSGDVVALRYAGFALWIVAVYFAAMPIWVLSRNGDVPAREAYMQTTRLVTCGPFAIVRHPQFVGALLLSVALMLVSQHTLIIFLGLLAVPLIYWAACAADLDGLMLFGDAYDEYMRRVPRFNPVSGLLRRRR